MQMQNEERREVTIIIALSQVYVQGRKEGAHPKRVDQDNLCHFGKRPNYLLLFHRPASTSTLAVPARSSYNLLKSSTDCFFKFNLLGVNILRSITP
jgi:hypothetical protein